MRRSAVLFALLSLAVAAPAAAEPPAPPPADEAIAEAPAPSGAPDPLEVPVETRAPVEDSGAAQRARDNAEVIRLAEEAEGGVDGPRDLPSMGGALLKMVVVLGGVSLLAYLLLGKVLPRAMRVPTGAGGQRIMRVVDRLPIDQRRSILVVAVGDEHFMVGASEGGIHLISRLDADQIPTAPEADPPSGGLSRFAEALTQRRSKEG